MFKIFPLNILKSLSRQTQNETLAIPETRITCFKWSNTKPIMSDKTYPKNGICILWLAYYRDGGSVLYCRPCRRESGHKWQETEIRNLETCSSASYNSAAADRKIGGIKSTRAADWSIPLLQWLFGPFPPSAQMYRNSTLEAPDNKRAFSLYHNPPESQGLGSQTSGRHSPLLYSIHQWNSTKEAQFPLLWISGWENVFYWDITSAWPFDQIYLGVFD